MKTGKSSFLNALFFNGEEILPKAATAMTAGLTILEYSDKCYFEVEYYTVKEWALFEEYALEYKITLNQMLEEERGKDEELAQAQVKELLGDIKFIAYEMVTHCSQSARAKINHPNDVEHFSLSFDMQERLKDFVGVNGKYMPVTKSLKIYLNDSRLQNMQVIDTPGVDDPVRAREIRTQEILRSCHGVFLLSDSSSFCDDLDMKFLQERVSSEGIGQVVILGSKWDLLFVMEAERCKQIGRAHV